MYILPIGSALATKDIFCKEVINFLELVLVKDFGKSIMIMILKITICPEDMHFTHLLVIFF